MGKIVTVDGKSPYVFGGVLNNEVPDVLPGAAAVAPTHNQWF